MTPNIEPVPPQADISGDESSRPRFPGGELTPAEVRELWFFVHGDVMEGGIREQLRAAFGLCPRHTWAYAVVEIELWQFGSGPRGGHQPFDVCVLYEDLLSTVADRLTHHRIVLDPAPERKLRPTASCRVCDAVNGPGNAPELTRAGYAGSDTTTLVAEANSLQFTKAWLRDTEHVWRPRACPRCVTDDLQSGPSTTAAESPRQPGLCRLHLIDSAPIDSDTVQGVIRTLQVLRERLVLLTESMTQRGSPPSSEVDAAWIQTLGWFAGWQLPAAYLRTPDDG